MVISVKCIHPATMPDDDNRVWAPEDFAKVRPASEILHDVFHKTVSDDMLKRGSQAT